MNLLHRGLSAALLSLCATAAQALPVTIDFAVDLYSDIPAYDAAPGFGSLTYEDGALTNSGYEAMAAGAHTADPLDPFDYDVLAGLTSFSITLFAGEAYEQTFTASDDFDFPTLPELFFFDGELYGLNFYVDGIATSILAPGVEIVLANYDCGCFGEFFFSSGPGDPNWLTVFAGTDVPAPAALPLMLGGIAALGLAARRRKG